jgi:hypothetical protein
LRERLRHGEADPRGRAGHDNDFARKIPLHLSWLQEKDAPLLWSDRARLLFRPYFRNCLAFSAVM